MSAPMPVDKKTSLVNLNEDAPAPPPYETSQLVNRTNEILSHQLRPTAQMSIGGTRNAKSMPVGLDGQRSFNHGLCNCCERPGLSAAVCLCPCSVWASNRSRMNHLTETGTPNPAPERVGLWCALYAVSPQLLGIGQVLLQGITRFQTRQRYGIRGNPVEDTLIAAFLPWCGLVQEYREIEDEEAALTQESAAPETFYRDEEEAAEGAAQQ